MPIPQTCIFRSRYKRFGPNLKAVIDQFKVSRPGEQKGKAVAKAKCRNAADAKKWEQEKQNKSVGF